MRRVIVLLAALCLVVVLPTSSLGSQAKSYGIRNATAFFVSGHPEECGPTDRLILTVADGAYGANYQGPGEFFMWFDIQYYSEDNCVEVPGSYHSHQFDLTPESYAFNGLTAAWFETPANVDVDGRQFGFDLAWITNAPLDVDVGNGVSLAYGAHLSGLVYDSQGTFAKANLDYATINWARNLDK